MGGIQADWGTMSRPEVHYPVTVKNHVPGEVLRVELVDLPSAGRSFRLRVNGRWAERIPVGSKSTVLTQVRKWRVAH